MAKKTPQEELNERLRASIDQYMKAGTAGSMPASQPVANENAMRSSIDDYLKAHKATSTQQTTAATPRPRQLTFSGRSMTLLPEPTGDIAPKSMPTPLPAPASPVLPPVKPAQSAAMKQILAGLKTTKPIGGPNPLEQKLQQEGLLPPQRRLLGPAPAPGAVESLVMGANDNPLSRLLLPPEVRQWMDETRPTTPGSKIARTGGKLLGDTLEMILAGAVTAPAAAALAPTIANTYGLPLKLVERVLSSAGTFGALGTAGAVAQGLPYQQVVEQGLTGAVLGGAGGAAGSLVGPAAGKALGGLAAKAPGAAQTLAGKAARVAAAGIEGGATLGTIGATEAILDSDPLRTIAQKGMSDFMSGFVLSAAFHVPNEIKGSFVRAIEQGKDLSQYRRVLGVTSNATEAEIKAAYHKLARQYHPDINPAPDATARMAEINDAYNVLINAGRLAKVVDAFTGEEQAKEKPAQPTATAAEAPESAPAEQPAPGPVAGLPKASGRSTTYAHGETWETMPSYDTARPDEFISANQPFPAPGTIIPSFTVGDRVLAPDANGNLRPGIIVQIKQGGMNFRELPGQTRVVFDGDEGDNAWRASWKLTPLARDWGIWSREKSDAAQARWHEVVGRRTTANPPKPAAPEATTTAPQGTSTPSAPSGATDGLVAASPTAPTYKPGDSVMAYGEPATVTGVAVNGDLTVTFAGGEQDVVPAPMVASMVSPQPTTPEAKATAPEQGAQQSLFGGTFLDAKFDVDQRVETGHEGSGLTGTILSVRQDRDGSMRYMVKWDSKGKPKFEVRESDIHLIAEKPAETSRQAPEGPEAPAKAQSTGKRARTKKVPTLVEVNGIPGMVSTLTSDEGAGRYRVNLHDDITGKDHYIEVDAADLKPWRDIKAGAAPTWKVNDRATYLGHPGTVAEVSYPAGADGKVQWVNFLPDEAKDIPVGEGTGRLHNHIGLSAAYLEPLAGQPMPGAPEPVNPELKAGQQVLAAGRSGRIEAVDSYGVWVRHEGGQSSYYQPSQIVAAPAGAQPVTWPYHSEEEAAAAAAPKKTKGKKDVAPAATVTPPPEPAEEPAPGKPEWPEKYWDVYASQPVTVGGKPGYVKQEDWRTKNFLVAFDDGTEASFAPAQITPTPQPTDKKGKPVLTSQQKDYIARWAANKWETREALKIADDATAAAKLKALWAPTWEGYGGPGIPDVHVTKTGVEMKDHHYNAMGTMPWLEIIRAVRAGQPPTQPAETPTAAATTRTAGKTFRPVETKYPILAPGNRVQVGDRTGTVISVLPSGEPVVKPDPSDPEYPWEFVPGGDKVTRLAVGAPPPPEPDAAPDQDEPARASTPTKAEPAPKVPAKVESTTTKPEAPARETAPSYTVGEEVMVGRRHAVVAGIPSDGGILRIKFDNGDQVFRAVQEVTKYTPAQNEPTPDDGLVVGPGLTGDTWGVFRVGPNGSKHRVQSPALPMVPTREEAEANLAAYRAKNAKALGATKRKPAKTPVADVPKPPVEEVKFPPGARVTNPMGWTGTVYRAMGPVRIVELDNGKTTTTTVDDLMPAPEADVPFPVGSRVATSNGLTGTVTKIDGDRRIIKHDGGSGVSSAPAAGLKPAPEEADNAPSQGMLFSKKGTRDRFERPAPSAGLPAASASRNATVPAGHMQDIWRYIDDNFAPIRLKFVNRGAAGVYKTWHRVIRTRGMNIGTMMHELGHHLDQTLKLNELPHATQTIPRSPQAALYTDPELKRLEGIADWFRDWFQEPELAEQDAPDFAAEVKQVLAGTPELEARVREMQRMVVAQVSADPVSRVRSTIVFGPEDEPKVPITERVKQWVNDQEENWDNDLVPFARAKREITGGKPVPANRDPEALAMFHRKARFTIPEAWVKKGQVDPDHPDKMLGPSLQSILKPVKGREKDFWTYAVSMHAIEVIDAGKTMNLDRRTYAEAASRLEAANPEFADVLSKVVEFNNNATLTFMVRSGIMSTEAYGKMRALYEYYIPFNRFFEDEGTGPRAAGKGYSAIQGGRRIKGSTRSINNPLENIVRNTYLMADASLRNDVVKALHDLTEQFEGSGRIAEPLLRPMQAIRLPVGQIKERVRQALKGTDVDPDLIDETIEDLAVMFQPSWGYDIPKANVTWYWQGGEPQFMQLRPDLYRAVKALQQERLAPALQSLSVFTKMLRSGAVMSPTFWSFRNPVRDSLNAFLFSRYGFNPVTDWTKGLFHILKQDKWYDEFRAAGGPMATMAALDREYYRKIAGESRFEKPEGFDKVLAPLVKANDFLNGITEAFESAPRLMEYIKARESGASALEASLASADLTVNFARGGRHSKVINSLVAFFNTTLQGASKDIREFRRDPWGQLLKSFLVFTIPSLVLWFVNRGNPYYDALPTYRKDLFWNVPLPGGKHFFPIPKGNLRAMLFATLPERLLDRFAENDPNAIKEWQSALWQQSAPSVIPAVMIGPLQWWANKSMFTGAPIVPANETSLPAAYQFGPETSEVAKAVGRLLNQSPRQIDAFIRGQFGSVGGLATEVSTDVIRLFKGSAAPRPGMKVNDIPLVRDFVASPERGSEDVEEFYSIYQRLSQTNAALNANLSGRKSELLLSTSQGKEYAAKWETYQAAESVMRNLRAVRQQLEQAKGVDPNAQREAIYKVNLLIINTARVANGKKEMLKVSGQ